MAEQVRLWKVGAADRLLELSQSPLDLESRLQEWLADDISLLDPNLLVIGREVQTDYGGFIDLLCLNRLGDLVVVELKRDKTPRTITAQALDYGSWVAGLSNERIRSLHAEFRAGRSADLDAEFQQRFGSAIPETLNSAHHLLVVGSAIDESSERIIRYLSETYGVSINAATFQYFRDTDGQEFISRVFLIDPSRVEDQVSQHGTGKRQRNLTPEELLNIAEEQGIATLYSQAVDILKTQLRSRATRSSIGFLDTRSGKQKVVLSLLPSRSSPSTGVAYQIYGRRFSDLCGTDESDLVRSLPPGWEPWAYESVSAHDPDWTGYQGYFSTIEQLLPLVDLLQSAGNREETAPRSD